MTTLDLHVTVVVRNRDPVTFGPNPRKTLKKVDKKKKGDYEKNSSTCFYLFFQSVTVSLQ